MCRFLPWIVLPALLASPAFAQQNDRSLALKARKVLRTYCQRCHHGEGSEGGSFDVLEHASLLTRHGDEPAVIVPRKLDGSRLWQRMGVRRSMPPKKETLRPSDADLAVVRKWIEAGAPPYPALKARSFLGTAHMLDSIRTHLQRADQADRRFLRYFTLTHLHNNPRVEDADLRLLRAALSKAVNSLSWNPRISRPQAVDREQTVFAVDLRDLDWDRPDLWRVLLREYPYGLKYADSRNKAVKRSAQDLDLLTGGELVHLRADWFVATATRPPLYHDLLRLPATAAALETRLRVSFTDNFARNKLVRAGFPVSGVSRQNRLVERHDSPIGNYYWKSYDFKPRRARANLTRFPLGPDFPGNPYARQAFKHDGGEMIFGLPNGLQATVSGTGRACEDYCS